MSLSGTINSLIIAGVAFIAFDQYQQKKQSEYQEEIQARLEAFSDEDKFCLAQNIFFEARNQSELGQAAVAWVTLNRVDAERYPDTICDVVWQDRQFSWTHDGKSDEPSDYPEEYAAWLTAQGIAIEVLTQYVSDGVDPTDGSTMYHADYVNPYWSRSYAEVTQIESHIFYKQYQ